MRRPTALLVIGGCAVALVPRATPARPRTRLQASLDSFLADRSAAKLFYDGVTDGKLNAYDGPSLEDNSLDDQKKISALVDYMHTELMKKSMMARSRRPAVLRCLHAIDAQRLQERMSWLVSFSILRPFGPSRDHDAPRHPADTDTTSRRWRGRSTPSSRRGDVDVRAGGARRPMLRTSRRRSPASCK